jgi:hypothetical protein
MTTANSQTYPLLNIPGNSTNAASLVNSTENLTINKSYKYNLAIEKKEEMKKYY